MSDGDRQLGEVEKEGSARSEEAGMEIRVFGSGMTDPSVEQPRLHGPMEDVSEGYADELSDELDDELSDEFDEDDEDEEVIKLVSDTAPERRVPKTPLAKRKLEDEEWVAPSARNDGRMGLGMLTLLMGAAAVVLALVGVVVMVPDREEPQGEESDSAALTVVDDDEVSFDAEDLARTQAELEALAQQARTVALRYLEASTLKEALPLIRNGDALRSTLEARWEPFGLDQERVAQVEISAIDFHGKDLVSLVIVDDSGDRHHMSFLEEGGEMLFDWEASLGVGDVAYVELSKIPVGTSVKLRAFVQASNFHPLEFPEEQYRCFRLQGRKELDQVFGFSKHGSEVSEALSMSFNENSSLFRAKDVMPMILEVTNVGQGSFGQFEITKVMQEGWIEP